MKENSALHTPHSALLTIDVGNSQTVCGVFEAEKLAGEWRYPTDKNIRVDTCEAELKQRLLSAGIKAEQVTGCVISCVVPSLSDSFKEVCLRLFGIEPLFVNIGLKMDISVKYEKPEELGADRIANAVAVHHFYPGDTIIVDLGTATTFCVVSGKGDYLGGAIAPGVGVSLKALVNRAALLPSVDLCPPGKVIGGTTVESMRSGFVYGFADMIDGIVKRMRKEFSSGAQVIATGGWADLIGQFSQVITITDISLTLKGLRIIYEMNS